MKSVDELYKNYYNAYKSDYDTDDELKEDKKKNYDYKQFELDNEINKESNSTVFQNKMIDVAYYLFNAFGISTQPGRLMLPKWVNVSKERFNEIPSKLLKLKTTDYNLIQMEEKSHYIM